MQIKIKKFTGLPKLSESLDPQNDLEISITDFLRDFLHFRKFRRGRGTGYKALNIPAE